MVGSMCLAIAMSLMNTMRKFESEIGVNRANPRDRNRVEFKGLIADEN
jgi:hypothetical protein